MNEEIAKKEENASESEQKDENRLKLDKNKDKKSKKSKKKEENKENEEENEEDFNNLLPSWSISSPANYKNKIQIFENKNEISSSSFLYFQNLKYFLFGRKKEISNYSLKDSTISRKHSLLCFNSLKQTFLIDLNSTYGTFINTQQIPPMIPFLLQNNDKIQFGQCLKIFLYLEEEEEESNTSFRLEERKRDEEVRKEIEIGTKNDSNRSNTSSNISKITTFIGEEKKEQQQKDKPNIATVILSKEEQRREREKEIALYALEMSSTVPIFNSTKTFLTKEELLLAAKVSY